MRKFISLIALCLSFSGPSQAIGLADIELESGLNQKLNARIRLLSVQDDQIADIQVGLGDAAAFERFGIGRPYVLTTLRFSIEHSPGAGSFIRITSRDYIQEPFLNFVVALDGPGGTILREYTLLLQRRTGAG